MQGLSGGADKKFVMSVWSLIVLMLVGLVSVSLVVGLSLGAILGHISRELSDLIEWEAWQRVPAPSSGDAEARASGRRKISAPAA